MAMKGELETCGRTQPSTETALLVVALLTFKVEKAE